MKSFKIKRAVSPIIATMILIGLAVVAGSMITAMVIGILITFNTPSLQITDGPTVCYDSANSNLYNQSWGRIDCMVHNGGIGTGSIASYSLTYKNTTDEYDITTVELLTSFIDMDIVAGKQQRVSISFSPLNTGAYRIELITNNGHVLRGTAYYE